MLSERASRSAVGPSRRCWQSGPADAPVYDCLGESGEIEAGPGADLPEGTRIVWHSGGRPVRTLQVGGDQRTSQALRVRGAGLLLEIGAGATFRADPAGHRMTLEHEGGGASMFATGAGGGKVALEPQRVEIDLADATAPGALRFSLPRSGPAIVPTIRYYYGTPAGTLHRIVLSLFQEPPGPQAVSLDPSAPDDRRRSFVGAVGTAPAPSCLRTTTGETVWLSAVAGQSQYVAQLDPIDGSGYFTLAGPWLPQIRTGTGWRALTTDDRLLCGLSGNEYLVVADGAPLIFHPDQPAYAAWAGGGAPAPAPGRRLVATLADGSTPATTSWLSTGPSSAYASQPDQSIYYASQGNSAGSPVLGDAGLLMGPAATPTDAAIFPLGPYAGLDPTLTTVPGDCRDFELEVLSIARHDILASFAAAERPSESSVGSLLAITSQGMLLTKSRGLLGWHRLQLANTTQPIVFEGLHRVLQSALQSSQLCLVVSDKAMAEAACDALQAEFAIAGWNFNFTPDQWIEDSDLSQSTILIFKYHNRPLGKLIADPGLWADPGSFNSQSPSAVASALQSILEAAKSNGSSAYDYLLDTVFADPNWNGVVVFNCTAPVAELPPEIEGLAAGIDASRFRAHHVGIGASAIDAAGDRLAQGASALFGLIDYSDPDPNPPAPPAGKDYAFAVRYLRVLFLNSQIASFGSAIELYVGKLFGDAGTFAAERSMAAPNVVTLNGVYQNHDGHGSYTFSTAGAEVFTFEASSLLHDLAVDQVQFVTVIGSTQTPSAQVKSRFLFWGSLRFKDLATAFPGNGYYDLLSFGPSASGDSKLAFANLALTMTFTPGGPQEPLQDFFFDASTLSVDPSSTLARPASLLAGMGLTVAGMIQGALAGGVTQTPASLDFAPFDVPFATAALGAEWYGLQFRADLGSRGAFAPRGGFSASVLVAWSPQGGEGPQPQVFAGIQLPGGGNNRVSLQGVADLDFPAIRLAGQPRPDADRAIEAGELPWRYSLSMDRSEFKLLSQTFPIGGLDVYAYHDSASSALVWYGVFNLGSSFPPVPHSSGDVSLVAPIVLSLLAIGQNIKVAGLDTDSTVDSIVDTLKQTLKPVSDPSQKLPDGIEATSGNQWLIALKFVIADTVTVTFLYNDPTLAGGTIALSGDAAKSLSGLSLEVLYSKISDTIGHWHARITFPTIGGPDEEKPKATKFKAPKLVAPHEGLEFTIPTLTIDVFTNGDFKVNVGYPDGTDFSSSLMAKIGGMVGRGGFYFGKLRSATTSAVPAITNGTFQPVIEVGVGISVGRYWDADAGVLKGSAEIDFLFMFQGVFATFLPTDTSQSNDHYVMVNVTAGLQIIITGQLDFGIISASLTAKVTATLSFTIESYAAVTITAAISIEFECSVKILFIRVSFSFSTEFHYTFELTSGSTPPWTLDSGASSLTLPGRLRMQRLARPRSAPRWRGYRQRSAPRRLYTLEESRPPKLKSEPVFLNVVAMPAVTVASSSYLHPHDGSPTPQAPAMLAVMQLGLENGVAPNALGVAAIKERRHVRAGAAAPGGDSNLTPFDELAQAVLLWMISLKTGQTSGTVDAAELSQLMAELSEPANLGTVFSLSNLTDFLKANFIVNLLPVIDGAGHLEATPFPLGPLFGVVPQGKTTPPADPILPADYAAMVQAYFAQMTDTVVSAPTDGTADADPITMSQMQFLSYFTLLAKGVVGNALTLLKALPYTLPDTAPMPSLATIANKFDVAALDLVTALATGQGPTLVTGASVPLATLNYQIQSGDTLGFISAAFPELDYGDGTAIAQANLGVPILAPGAMLSLTPTKLVAAAGDTFDRIAALLLARNGQVADVPDPVNMQRTLRAGIVAANAATVQSFALLAPGSSLTIPGSSQAYIVRAGDTLDLVAGYFLMIENAAWPDQGALKAALAELNPNGLQTGQPIAVPALQHEIASGETLDGIGSMLFLDPAAVVPAIVSKPILLPGGVLNLPSATLSTQADTTLSMLAKRYNLSMADLTAAVGDVAGLLPAGSIITVGHANQIEVDLLLSTLATGNPQTNYNNVAGLVSRFMMHGVRVPDPADPVFSKMTPAAILASTTVFDTFAIPDLMGMQIPIASGATSLDVTFTRLVEEPWVLLGGDPGSNSLAAALPLGATLPSPDTIISPTVIAMPPTHEVPLSFDLQQVVHWQTADWSFLPASEKPVGAGEPTIWMFPPALTRYLQQVGGSLLPQISPIGSPESPTAATAYRFATKVRFRIRQVGGSAPLANTYMLIGAGQNDRALIEEIFTSLQPGTPLQLFLLYPPAGAGANAQGLASDEINRFDTSIQQVNLSTVTSENDPGALAEEQMQVVAYSATAQAYDAPDFLRLLWQCSIVGQGGYYLNYATATAQGLPAALFASSADAELALLVVWEMESGISANVPPYVNALVLGDNIDPTAVRLSLLTDGTRTVATLPAGRAGFTMTRANPDRQPQSPDSLTEQLYSLAGGVVLGGVEASRQLRPFGPIPPDGASTFAGPDWFYSQSLPIYRVAPPSRLPDSPALPSASADPYAGIAQAATMTISLVFQDVFGNQRGPLFDGDPAQTLDVPLVYSDDLIAVDQWPSIVSNYRIAPDPESGAATIIVALEMTADKLAVHPGQPVSAARDAATQLAVRLNKAYYQASQPDIGFTLSANLDGDAPHLLPASAIKNFLAACAVHVAAVEQQSAVIYSVPASPPVTLAEAAATLGVNAADLLAVNGDSLASAVFADGLMQPEIATTSADSTLQSLAEGAGISVEQLVARNSSLGVMTGAILKIPSADATVPTPGLSLAALAAASSVSPAILADANHGKPGLIAAGIPLSLGTAGIVTENGATFDSLVVAFLEAGAPESLTATGVAIAVAGVEDLLIPGAKFAYSASIAPEAATLGKLAAQFTGFASLNAASTTLLSPGSRVMTGSTTADWSKVKNRPLAEIAQTLAITIPELADANEAQALAPGAQLVIPGSVGLAAGATAFAPYTAVSGDTLAGIGAKLGVAAIEALGEINRSRPLILAVGSQIEPAVTPAVPPYTIASGDTLDTVFAHYQALGIATFEAFIASVAGLDTLIEPGAMVIGPFATTVSDSLDGLATATGVAVSEIVGSNSALHGFLKVGAQVAMTSAKGEVTLSLGPWDSLNSLVARFADQGIVATAQDIARKYAGQAGMVATGQPYLLPPKSLEMAVAVPRTNMAVLSPIIVGLQIARDPALAPNAPATVVTAKAILGAAAAPGAKGTLGFDAFAQEFEAAYPGLKLATTKSGDSPLWWVDFSSNGITVAPVGGAVTYALPPLCNHLRAGQVSIQPFVPGGES